MPLSKIVSCSTNVWPNFPRIDSARSLNISNSEKKTLTRWPILPSKISSKCAIKPPPLPSGQKRSSIICSKGCCPGLICRFMRWSHLRGCLIPRQQNAPGSKTALSSAALSARDLCYSLQYCWRCFTNTNEPNLKWFDSHIRMHTLDHLFDNNRNWAGRIRERDPQFFLNLARQQSPTYFWIGCSDSRVPANQIVGLAPGELFVHRNVANLVVHTDLNCLSAMQFAVEILRVRHIIVCGHYGCSGVGAAFRRDRLGLSDNWVCHVEDVRLKHDGLLARAGGDAEA